MSQPYTYEPLDSEKKSVRLLTILPRRGATIECTSRVAINAPSYSALSYTWGSSKKTKPILINGKRFDVRENLWDFLDLASRHRPGLVIWIDAICIDQGNHSEKTRQVRLMGRIYSNAESVLIWLGKDLDLHALTQLVREDSNSTDVATAWRLIAEHAYWTRLWIIQETLLAAKLYIFSEHGNICLDSLQLVRSNAPHSVVTGTGLNLIMDARLELLKLCAAWQHGHTSSSISRSMTNFWRTSSWKSLKVSWKSQHNIDFKQINNTLERAILSLLGRAGCYDMRDKVFGLLAFIPGGESFPGEYSDSPIEFFFKAIAFLGPTALDIRSLRRFLGVSKSQIATWLKRASRNTTSWMNLSRVPFGKTPDGREVAAIAFQNAVALIWMGKHRVRGYEKEVYLSKSWEMHKLPSSLASPNEPFASHSCIMFAKPRPSSDDCTKFSLVDIVIPKCVFAQMFARGVFGSNSRYSHWMKLSTIELKVRFADAKTLLQQM